MHACMYACMYVCMHVQIYNHITRNSYDHLCDFSTTEFLPACIIDVCLYGYLVCEFLVCVGMHTLFCAPLMCVCMRALFVCVCTRVNVRLRRLSNSTYAHALSFVHRYGIYHRPGMYTVTDSICTHICIHAHELTHMSHSHLS
jgi:hypothetical protein